MPEENKSEKKQNEMLCVSCGKRVEAETDWVEFNCPQCGKSRIIRCSKCKRLENTYKCPECGFRGP